MNPIVFALRRPVTVMVGVVSVLVGGCLAATRMKVDVFPSLNQPVIYVCQPYGGMSPQQMEGLLTSYYEFHFLYVGGIHHVESRNVQGMALMKLSFHPGADMAQSMAETVAAVNRARFMMPPGTVPPFVTRVDTGTAPVGYLVLSSQTRPIKEIQDFATLRVRPMFASVPGMSSPPAFGGNQRAIVVSVEAEKARVQNLTLEQITEAVAAGNSVTPSGNLRIADRTYLVNTNAMVGENPARELGRVPVKLGERPVLLRDVSTIEDAADITSGYVLVNGKRSVYMLVTKRADASTLAVVGELEKALPRMRQSVPDDVRIDFAFDQSPIVTEAIRGVGAEGLVGALLTGLTVLVFLRDWRSVVVVVLNIPIALVAAVFALWVAGQTINLMTLGGLSLAVGILVDESTVEVENIHAQMLRYDAIARAVRMGNRETAVPRFLAVLCILAVFVPSFFMEGAARELFVPLSLSVGFAMVASYLLSSTFVPVLSVWLLRPLPEGHPRGRGSVGRLPDAYERAVARIVRRRAVVVPLYLAAALAAVVALYSQLGTAIFPPTDKGQFTIRMKAPTGTRIEWAEEMAQEATRLIRDEVGAGNVEATVGYVGMIPTNYPVQASYQWTSGPGEVLLRVALKEAGGVRLEGAIDRLRDRLSVGLRAWFVERWKQEGLPEAQRAARLASFQLSFEPGDLVSEVMSFGSPTPVEVQVSGADMPANLAFARRLQERLAALPDLRDLQLNPAQDYPTVTVGIDRIKAATMDLTARGIGTALIPATASSRYMSPIYWRDSTSGQVYIVQVQVPPPNMNSIAEIGLVPVRPGATRNGPSETALASAEGWQASAARGMPAAAGGAANAVLLRDVAAIAETSTPAEVLRYNMRRTVSLTANLATEDIGRVRRQVAAAIAALKDEAIREPFRAREEALRKGDELAPAARAQIEAERAAALAEDKLPNGLLVDVRGRLDTLRLVQSSLSRGLLAAVLAIFLLLAAYFQSVRLSLVAVAALPATLCGVGLALLLTGTTLNVQSFMGAIMSLGVSVANAILLVTFAERSRSIHGGAVRAAVEGGRSRLRPVLMTSCAMVAGMVPMALGASAGGDQTAPLGRAVVGGLMASTVATLLVLPAVFASFQRSATTASASLDPDDPHSPHYDGDDAAPMSGQGPARADG